MDTRGIRSFGVRPVLFVLFLFTLPSMALDLSPAHAREKPGRTIMLNDPMFLVGEELEYRVSYSIFRLGTIRIQLVDQAERNGRVVYRARAFIDSAPALPFVNLHVLFESEFDEDVFSYYWLSRDSSRREISYRTFAFDYEQKHVIVERSTQKAGSSRVRERTDTVRIESPSQDGLSLFFYARKYLHGRKQETIPTVIEDKPVFTYIDYSDKRTSVEIDNLDYPVDVKEFDGRADYSGVFGLTGAFRGWFSNDQARVPIVARMKVILGSISIELVRWTRPNWTPPRFAGGRER